MIIVTILDTPFMIKDYDPKALSDPFAAAMCACISFILETETSSLSKLVELSFDDPNKLHFK